MRHRRRFMFFPESAQSYRLLNEYEMTIVGLGLELTLSYLRDMCTADELNKQQPDQLALVLIAVSHRVVLMG